MPATKLPNIVPAQSLALRSKTFSKCVDRNLNGIALEKEGNIDAAIALYEANIAARFDGTHPYERLRIIYSKQKCWDDAIRVCRAYIQFGQAGDLALKEKLRRFIQQHTSAVESGEDPVALTNDESAERERNPSPAIRNEEPSETRSRHLKMRMTNVGIEMSFGGMQKGVRSCNIAFHFPLPPGCTRHCTESWRDCCYIARPDPVSSFFIDSGGLKARDFNFLD
jgi:hypothetical protein